MDSSASQIAAPTAEVADLKAQIAHILSTLTPEITRLKSENADLRLENAALKKRVKLLEAKLKLDSTNSHQPPSADMPKDKPPTNGPPKPGKLKKGAQPGHPFHERNLVDLQPGDSVVPYLPICPCGAKNAFDDLDLIERFQRFELPLRPVEVTEFQCYAGTCIHCKQRVEAVFPEALSRHAFGDRLTAFIAMASGEWHLSKRQIQAMLEALLGVPISVGSVVDQQQVVSQALAGAHEDIATQVRSSHVANVDETSWEVAGKLHWLWVMVNAMSALFLIQDSRSGEAARALIGEFDGVLGSDRYKSYEQFNHLLRQLCWAHLVRDFLKWELKGSRNASALLNNTRRLFEAWWDYKAGKKTWEEFQVSASIARTCMTMWLKKVEAEKLPEVSGKATELLRQWEHAWTFAHHPGIEPTNNLAERMLRKAVLWRKCSFGTASEKGSRFAERILSFLATMKLRGKDQLDALEEAVKAFRAGGLIRVPAL